MNSTLLKDLAIAMAAAGAMTLLCQRFRQPLVIGYLLAGLLIGPHSFSLPIISNLTNIHIMAELGLVLLLFALGLEFNLPKIHKVGLSAGLATFFSVFTMNAVGFILGLAFGWNKIDSLFLGAILSISSTTIIAKVFTDFKLQQEKFAQVVFGILIIEDIFAVGILSILSTLGIKNQLELITLVEPLLRVGLFITLFLVVGLVLVPKVVHWAAQFQSDEVLGIVTLAFCFGGTMAAHSAGLSVALGAFLMGAVIAASKEINLIEKWIHPLRDMFSVLFFVSTGMLIQPALVWEYKGSILLITLVTIVAKFISGAAGSFLAGYDLKTSARVGMSLTQIGEFSFVIASLGATLNITSAFLYPLAAMVSSLTTLATPALIRHSDRLVDFSLAYLPDGFKIQLENWNKKISIQSQAHFLETAIFSKYLLRGGVYGALLVGGFAFIKGVQLTLSNQSWPEFVKTSVTFLLWLGGGIFFLPLFGVISKYANHIILLVVTKSKWILRVINVHSFYNTMNFLTLLLLMTGFIFPLTKWLTIYGSGLLAITLIWLSETVFKKRGASGKEWLEQKLDHITGLATSEPTRQAVLQSGDRSLLLVDITDQFTIMENASCAGKTIRQLKLREETGATLVAIYRQGKHMANPGPDTTLHLDDVLVVLGNPEELEKAKHALT